MSVLTCVFEEELCRCCRHREAVLRDLQEEGISDKRRELLQQVLLQIAEDLCRLRRALAPVDLTKIDELGFNLQGD